ncbi:DUF6801 domain-containing protein [Streptomyces sp. NPDC058195]|uniref:DUF6801 domain-containing protein n=1 Tax=Streptomyces sp. NPDC058195 TaxID=3346375 RepID=UPI0036EA0A72
MANVELIQNPCGRQAASRFVPRGPVARAAWGLVVTAGVMGTGVGVFGAVPAAAEPVSRTLRYTCSVPMADERRGTVEIDSDVPKSAAVGKPTPKFAIHAVVSVGEADARALRKAGIKTITGTVDAKAHVTAPGVETDLGVPFQVARTSVPASGPFRVEATGVAPTRTFTRPGGARITVGDLTAHVTASGGIVTVKLDLPCGLDPGQNNVVASFDVAGAGTTTGPAPSGAADTATPGTSGSRNPGDGAGTSTAPEGPADPSGAMAETGSRGTRILVPLAVGSALLGTLAVAAAFRFRSRGR